MPKTLTQGRVLFLMHKGEVLTKLHGTADADAPTIYKLGGFTVRAATVNSLLFNRLIIPLDGGLFGDDPHTYRLAIGDELK